MIGVMGIKKTLIFLTWFKTPKHEITEQIRNFSCFTTINCKDGVHKVPIWNIIMNRRNHRNEQFCSWKWSIETKSLLHYIIVQTICGVKRFLFWCIVSQFFRFWRNLLRIFKSYLPGPGDTVIKKAVLPGRGPSIALRLGWLLQVILMRLPWGHNFC